MDGWETRRRRTPGHDWCIVRLGLRGVIRSVVVDTAFFRGNYPEQCSIDAADDDEVWHEILPITPLQGDSVQRFAIADSLPVARIPSASIPTGAWRDCAYSAKSRRNFRRVNSTSRQFRTAAVAADPVTTGSSFNSARARGCIVPRSILRTSKETSRNDAPWTPRTTPLHGNRFLPRRNSKPTPLTSLLCAALTP